MAKRRKAKTTAAGTFKKRKASEENVETLSDSKSSPASKDNRPEVEIIHETVPVATPNPPSEISQVGTPITSPQNLASAQPEEGSVGKETELIHGEEFDDIDLSQDDEVERYRNSETSTKLNASMDALLQNLDKFKQDLCKVNEYIEHFKAQFDATKREHAALLKGEMFQK